MSICADFSVGSRFAAAQLSGVHPVHDTVSGRYWHLNFFQHECVLEVRTPRVKLPDGSVQLVEPPFAGNLKGFTLLLEALVLALCREMPFAAVARIVNATPYNGMGICTHYVEQGGRSGGSQRGTPPGDR